MFGFEFIMPMFLTIKSVIKIYRPKWNLTFGKILQWNLLHEEYFIMARKAMTNRSNIHIF